MKNFIIATLIFTLSLFMFSCEHSVKNGSEYKEEEPISKIESPPNKRNIYEKTPEEIRELKRQDATDSITSLRTLELALQIAIEHSSESHFSLESDTLGIDFGYLFSKTKKHLVVKRKFGWGIFTDIFLLKNQAFKSVCSKRMSCFTYIGDSIVDINGDGKLDFFVHWYPPAGCCPRDVYDVFLQSSTGVFSREFEFMNPVFSPREKIIRGRSYGYEAPLYKYKWRGFNVDTLEFIYFPGDENGPHLVKRRHDNRKEKGQRLRELPDEFKKIGYNYEPGQYATFK